MTLRVDNGVEANEFELRSTGQTGRLPLRELWKLADRSVRPTQD